MATRFVLLLCALLVVAGLAGLPPVAAGATPVGPGAAAVTAAAGSASAGGAQPPGAALGPAAAPGSATAEEAAASAEARASGRRVEVAGRRSETIQVFAQPDGAFSMEQSVVPERVRRGTAWVEVDTSLHRRADGVIAPRASAADVAFSPGGDGPLVRVQHAGAELALSWPSPLPKPTVQDGTATYPEVMPGVDLRVRATVRGFAHDLVVKNAEAAANPALARIAFDVDVRGARLVADATGNLQVLDAAGQVVLQAPAPLMWDSTPPGAGGELRKKSAAVGVELSPGRLVLLPDKAMLADPGVTFPLVIDPDYGTVTPTRSAWSFVRLAYPENRYWNIEPSDDDELYNGLARVGHAPGYGSNWLDRSLFRFDTTAIRGAVIEEARFQAFQEWKYSNSCDPNHADVPAVELWRTGPINEHTRWNAQPGWDRRVSTIRSVNKRGYCAPDWIGMDAKGAAQEAADNGWLDVTLGLKATDDDESNRRDRGWKRFHSKVGFYPKLYIKYNHRPNAPHSVFTAPPLPTPCRWCGGVPFVGSASIDLKMHLSDPQGGQLRGGWDIWSPSYEGRSQWLPSGSIYTTTLDLTAKHGQTVTWRVAGDDGALFGPLADGPRFTVDRVAPNVEPSVTSALYPANNNWHGGSGVPDVFTFGPSEDPNIQVPDIDHYLYGFSNPPWTKVDAAALGGSASVTLAPPGDGPRDLYVQSVDRAGNRSPTQVHHFYVRAGNGPASQWPLDGNAVDDAFLGDRDGTVRGGAVWGPGAVGSAVRLDGLDDHVTAPNTVSTEASFSVSAWVQLDRLAAPGAALTAVSQDGVHSSGFFLQQRGTSFVFATTTADGSAAWSIYAASAPNTAQVNTWVHVAAVYDRPANMGHLYVNGELAASNDADAPWNAGGAVAIGRARWYGPADAWSGSIDEVRVYDRALSAAAVQALVGRDNVHAAHWKFDETTGVTADNAVEGGSDGVLTNGATWGGGAVGNAVRLDGIDDHVVTGAPAVRTDASYSVALWVWADRLAAPGAALTAVSQDGVKSSGFFLQQRGTEWVFATTAADGSPTWSVFAVSAPGTAQGSEWTHLAAVYDRAANMGHLYVNGVLAASNDAVAPWHAGGNLVVGRAKWYGPADPWPGSIDEVRVYSRVLAPEEIRGMITRDDVAAGSWRLDGDADDDSGRGRHGTPVGSPTWTVGQTDEPVPDDRAVLLDGIDDHVTAPNAVDTTRSFATSAWVRLDQVVSRPSAVVGQEGTHRAGFRLGTTGQGRWSFAMHGRDDATFITLVSATSQPGSVQAGVWTHLAGVYDAAARQIQLYVNGAAVATVAHHSTWNAGGLLTIGRSGSADFLLGAIDDVRVYQRTLFQDEVRALAGRDLSLIHRWRLDETAGGTAADSVGARQATLNNGAAFATGRAGNGVTLDGVDDDVTTTGVNLRTDTSFTASAMVRLGRQNGQVTAVSVDGAQTSKFRLGHSVDDPQHPEGAWIFEMPETDAGTGPTRAALSTLPGELDTWVLLVGVYDAPNHKMWLYVNGDRVGDATFSTPWNATGPVRIGRGKHAGAATQAWPGLVDDVRLYTGALSRTRVLALYDSYQAYPTAQAPRDTR